MNADGHGWKRLATFGVAATLPLCLATTPTAALAATGARKWGVELDHIDAVEASAEERAKARKAWKELVSFYNCAYGVPGMWNGGTVESQRRAIALMKSAGIEPPPGPDSFAELGMEEVKPSGQALDWKYMTETAKSDSGLNKAKGLLAKFGWAGESWYHAGRGCGCIGQAFPTPLYYDNRLYVCTAFDSTFCLDMEGKVVWKSFALGIGAGDTCSRARSLVLYRDPDGKHPPMLINAMSGVARAFDPLTGRLIWRREMKNVYTTMASPAITRASGKDVLLCSGTDLPCTPVQMHAFLLPEGKELKVDGWHNPGTTMLTKHDEPDVVFFCGGGEHGGWENKGHCKHPTPAAVRFTVEGDTLKANVLWSGIDGHRFQSFVGLLYDRGRLWCNRHILDALTGVRVPGTEQGPDEKKQIFHFPFLVGDRVYGITSFSGGDSECFVYDWRTTGQAS